jgi:hypothetical protein
MMPFSKVFYSKVLRSPCGNANDVDQEQIEGLKDKLDNGEGFLCFPS